MIRRIGDHGFRVRSMYVESVRYAALVIMFLQSIHRLSDLERKKTQNCALDPLKWQFMFTRDWRPDHREALKAWSRRSKRTGTQRGIRILKYIRGS